MNKITSLGSGFALSVMASLGFVASASSDDKLLNLEKTVSLMELRTDLKTFQEKYHALHPAPYHSVGEEELARAFDHIERSIQEPMTVVEAWRLFSTINPVLGDAHAGVIIPKRSKIIQERLKEGERLFPLSVYFKEGNRLHVRLRGIASDGLDQDAEILAINGRKTSDLIPEMLQHMRGDNSSHRRVLLERWFAMEYWSLFGASDVYRIEYLSEGKVKEVILNGSDKLRDITSEKPFNDLFTYKIMANNTGYLRLDTFNKQYKNEFMAMTEEAFRDFKAKNIQNVIIDIRENGGGGNSMWQKGIMPYIADKPYRHVSSYKARVTEYNASEGDVIGEIQSGVYKTMTPPDLDNPLRFTGKIYLLIGNMTYSSAIHFAITLQDYKIATIAGQPSGGRAGTTGNVTHIALEATGLRAFAPVMLFSRPLGDKNNSPVQPDVTIKHYPENPDRDIEDLIQIIAANHQLGSGATVIP